MVDPKEKVFCNLAVVDHFQLLACLIVTIDVCLGRFALDGFLVNDEDLAEDQGPGKGREVVKQHLVEVVQVALLRPTHVGVRVKLG